MIESALHPHPRLDASTRRFGVAIRRRLFADQDIDYSRPAGDPGLFGPASVTWRVHANPVTLAVGGIAAVILELAEPRVRTGVWEHSSFRADPLGRMRRTAQAAMITTYGPTALVERRIAMVNRMHERVVGETPDGQAYRALDPELLAWVQVTAGYGFLSAFVRYAEPGLSLADQDRYYAEAAAVGERFGTGVLPRTRAEALDFLEGMAPRLRPHPIIGEFLALVRRVSPVGVAGLAVQPLIVEAALDLIPPPLGRRLQLPPPSLQRVAGRAAVSALAWGAGRLPNDILHQAQARTAAVAS